MKETQKSSSQERVTETASEWVVKLNAGKLSKEDAFAFEDWLGESAVHREVFKRVSAVWSDAGALLDEPEAELEEAPSIHRVVGAWVQTNPTAKGAAFIALCASICVVCLAVLLVVIAPFQTNGRQVLAQTEIGESETVTLADGSIVQLNTDTEIQTDFSGGVRAVKLMRGEAYFDVAKDPDRPFRVFAGNGVVEAVGTAFTVQIKNDVTEVIVTEGKVRLASAANAVERQGDEVLASNVTLALVESGRNAAFDGGLLSVEEVDDSAIAKKLAWRKGMLLFDGDSLEDALNEFERYTQTEIVILDEDVRNERIVGYFDAVDTERFLQTLEESFGIAVRPGGDGRVFLYRDDS